MKVFIAGIAGVLGRNVSAQLVAEGHAVTGLVRRDDQIAPLQAIGADAVLGDLLDMETVRAAAHGADAILHLASVCPATLRSRRLDWEESNRLWREVTPNLIRAAHENRVSSYVQQSIAAVHGDGRDKWITEETRPNAPPAFRGCREAEDLALASYQSRQLPVVILRGATLYGADSPLTRQLIDAVQARRFWVPGSGRQDWHWLHVQDMANAIVTATKTPAPGEVFLVADDWPFRAQEGMAFLAKKLGVAAPFHLPAPVPLPLFGDNPLLSSRSARYRNDKLKRMLGWAPRYPTYLDGWAQIFSQLGIPF